MATLIGSAGAQSLYDQFFDQYYFPFNPTTATVSGVHDYDGKLEDYSKAGVDRRVGALDQWLIAFGNEPPSPDRDLVLSYIRAGKLELETIKMWERDPDRYSSGITNSAF